MEAREAALGGFGDPGEEATGEESRVRDRAPSGDISRKRRWRCGPSPGGAPSRAAVCARKGPPPRWTEVAGFRGSEQGPRRLSPGRVRALPSRAPLGIPSSQPPVTRDLRGVLAARVQCPRSDTRAVRTLSMSHDRVPLSGLQGETPKVPLTGQTSSISPSTAQARSGARGPSRLPPPPNSVPTTCRALMLFLFIHLTSP